MSRYSPLDAAGDSSMQGYATRAIGDRVTLAVDTTITRVEAWVCQEVGANAVKLVIYDDDGGSGKAGTRLAIAPAFTVAGAAPTKTAQGSDLTVPLDLVAGNYWVIAFFDGANPASDIGFSNTGNCVLFDGVSYASPQTPFGTPTFDVGVLNRKVAVVLVGEPTPTTLPPVASVAPVITGSIHQGSTLTVTTPGVYTGDAIDTRTYQWQRDGVDIGGSTGTTYATQEADITHAVRVVETATNAGGSASQNSNALTITPTWTDTIIPAKYMRGIQINPAVYTSERLDAYGVAHQVSASSADLLTTAKARLDSQL